MIIETTHTDQGITYYLDLSEFRAAVKKAKGKALRFVTPDGAADIVDAGVLRKLLVDTTSVKIVLFPEAKKWITRAELIEPVYDEGHARKVWGPTIRGRERPDLYSPEPRIGLICLGREYEGGRGLIYLYLFPVSDGREVGTCLIA